MMEEAMKNAKEESKEIMAAHLAFKVRVLVLAAVVVICCCC